MKQKKSGFEVEQMHWPGKEGQMLSLLVTYAAVQGDTDNFELRQEDDGQDCNAWFNFALNPQTKDVELFVITITYPDGRKYTMNNDELASALYTIMEAAYEKRGLQIPDYLFEYDPYDYIGGGLDKFYDEYFGEFEDALYDAYRSN